jgi:hypothetical protein
VDPEDDAPSLGIGEANGSIGEQPKGLLRAARGLLKLKLLALQVPCRHTTAQLRENRVQIWKRGRRLEGQLMKRHKRNFYQFSGWRFPEVSPKKHDDLVLEALNQLS